MSEVNGSQNSVEKSTAERVEHVDSSESPAAHHPQKQGFGSKVKRHCARYWWAHVIFQIIAFLIITLCLVYVALPRISQQGVNKAHIEFTSLQFLNPTESTVVLTQSAILHSPSIFTPTLDPFNATLWLVTNGTYAAKPITMVTMPKIHALHPQSTADIVNQEVPILNLDSITNYAIAALVQKNVTVALTGRTKVHEGHLPVNEVSFNQTVTYAGLNGLAGFNVTDVKLNSSAKAGEPNLQGFAYIPNPSLMTIEMGNVTLELSSAKAGVIGNSTILNMTLKPGNNTLPMTSIVDQALVLSSMDPKTGILTMLIKGKESVYNGVHLTYYETALASNVLSLDMNVLEIIKNSA